MLNTLRNRLHGEEGFTLIELLVVILIIGILAAIAIPSFLNQKGKGEDAQAKSSVRSAQTAMETFYTDKGDYDCTTVAVVAPDTTGCGTALHAIESSLPAWSAASPTAPGDMFVGKSDAAGVLPSGVPTTTAYRVVVASKPSGRVYWIDKSGGTVTRGCYVPAGQSNGGCANVAASYGTW
ncbi:MAG: type II secretion system protein [Actinobacteria bacterium]|nr:MAG: type II secretion system protein [Actinomycetota bacterium]